MKLNNKYIIGTHVMFYEIEILHEYIDSLIQCVKEVDNKENITFDFMFNLSIDSGSNYNVTKTSSYARAFNDEGSADGVLRYETTSDLAQGTGFQSLTRADLGNGDDEGCAGYIHLFDPSSTTFVKHFIANVNSYHDSDYTFQSLIAGYANTTSAVDAVQFKMDSGNIDAGDICLYGIN